VSRTLELAATTLAGALGALVAVLAVGASLVLVLPAALGVGIIAALSNARH
jgi:hypothetical protein